MLEFVGTLCIGSSLLSRTADLGLVFVLLPLYILSKRMANLFKVPSKGPRMKVLPGWIFQVLLTFFLFTAALPLIFAVALPLVMIPYLVNFLESPINVFYLWLLQLARPLGFEEEAKQSVQNRLMDARLGAKWTPKWIKSDMLNVIDKTSEQVDKIVPVVMGRQIPFVGLVGVILIIVAFAIK